MKPPPRALGSIVVVLACLALIVSCSDDSLTDFEGVYSISIWTKNTQSCDAAGDSILETQNDRFFYLKEVNFLGEAFLQAATCADSAACNEKLASDAINLLAYIFFEGSDSKGWRIDSTRLNESETCSGDVYQNTLTSPSEGNLLFERRSVLVSDVPLDSDGSCDEDAAKEMAETLPCSTLERLEMALNQ